jgi:hypothetical protein
MRTLRVGFWLGLGVALSFATASLAQMPVYREAGPVPPALAKAKTIFISNAGSDSGLFPEPFSGDPDRAYSEFYAALAANRYYALVDDPAMADLVLELRLTAPDGPSNPSKQNGASDPLPMFRLVIYNGRTHYVLWTVTRSVDFAILQKTHDKNLDAALADVLNQFLNIAGRPAAPAH